jgi:hypothetical protein
MGSRSTGGSKESKFKKFVQKAVRAILEWEDEQHKKQKRKGQIERDNY